MGTCALICASDTVEELEPDNIADPNFRREIPQTVVSKSKKSAPANGNPSGFTAADRYQTSADDNSRPPQYSDSGKTQIKSRFGGSI